MPLESSPDSQSASANRQTSGIAAHVARQTAHRPPPPKGRGIAIALLAAAVLIAVIVQFATSTGPAAHVRKQVEERKRARPVASPEPTAKAPVSAPQPTPKKAPGRRPELVPTDGGGDSTFPFEAPGANLAVPDGLSDRAAGRLRLSLAGLREAKIIAVSGVKDLAAMVEEASADDRPILRPFVIQKLTTLAGSPKLGAWALDAGLVLATEDAAGLAPLAVAARDPGLREDSTTPAAILFLGALGADERKASVGALAKLLRDDGRPVHLRVLAARTLTDWDAAPKNTEKLPAPVRNALEGK